jgi:hypothetical protein
MIYKMLCVFTILVVLGGLGYVSVAAVNSSFADLYDFQAWLPQALILVIGGGLLALTFYVLAQIIEVQLSMNAKMNNILRGFEQSENTNKQLLAEMEKIRQVVQGQARTNRLQSAPSSQSPQTVQPTTPSSAPTQRIP